MEHKWRKQYKKANVCYLMNFPGFTFYQQADGDMSFSVFFFFFKHVCRSAACLDAVKKKNDSEDGCVPQPLFPISHEHRRGQSPGNVSGSYLCCPLHSRARFKFKRFGVRIIGDG